MNTQSPAFWRKKLRPYTAKSDWVATRQILLTLIPFALIWTAYAQLVEISFWFALPLAVLTSFFILRMFVLMHDCGHGSMFKSTNTNKIVGFLLGVLTGMPQFVWSKNHHFHHQTNGDWEKYGGVFNITTTDKYAEMSEKEQKAYLRMRHPAILIPGGFLYVLFNPRFNWILGNILMVFKITCPLLSFNFKKAFDTAKKWETKYWKTKQDYKHMTYNNIVLLFIWFLMCSYMGTAEFFLLYATSVSLAGSLGILTFAIQHNFEDAYATDTERVNHYKAALEGTSMLVLPKVLNWFTADIAYHHVHHLSTAIPNYNLADFHKEYEDLFSGVKRIHLKDLLTTFDYQLWDPKKEKVVSSLV